MGGSQKPLHCLCIDLHGLIQHLLTEFKHFLLPNCLSVALLTRLFKHTFESNKNFHVHFLH